MTARSALLILLLLTQSVQGQEKNDGAPISAAGSGYSDLTSRVKRIESFGVRDWSFAAGNNSFRKALADRANNVVNFAQGTILKDTLKLVPYLAIVAQNSDAGGTILGAVYEGDAAGAGVALTNAGVSNLTVGVAAWAGAKIFASGGALLGSFFPVVGTSVGGAVGGVVGGVGGAVLTSLGYDAYIQSWVKSTAESAIDVPIDYVALARQARVEFEQQQHYYIDQARQARAEYLQQQREQQTSITAPGDGKPTSTDASTRQFLKDGGVSSNYLDRAITTDAAKKPVSETENAIVPDGSSVVMAWNYPRGPFPLHYTFNRVGRTMTSQWKLHELVGAFGKSETGSCAFDGSIEGVVISGTIECRQTRTDYGKKIEWSLSERLTIQLNSDRTLSGRETVKVVERCLAGCSDTHENTGNQTFAGSWHIRPKGNKPGSR